MIHPPGSVVLPCQEASRYTRFTISLADLELPPGSQRIFGIGTSIADNLNGAIRGMREQDEWVWLLGDDHVFNPDTLLRLLDTGYDMVAPLCVQRQPPFGLVHYDRVIEGTALFGIKQIEDLPDEPFEVEATGSLALIRREVLEAVGDPWFGTSNGLQNEDLNFCRRVRELGYKIMVDPRIIVGHIGAVIAFPEKRSGEWGLVLDFPGHGTNRIFIPGGVGEEGLALEPELSVA